MSDFFKNLKKKDYRHYICAAISFVFVGFGFLFPNAIPRLFETLRDLVFSVAFYVVRLINPESELIKVTVNKMPSWIWAESKWKPLTLFPYTWSEFKILWGQYWQVFISKENVAAYFLKLADIALYLSRYSLIVFLLGFLISAKLKSYTEPVDKPMKEGKSKQLKRFEAFLFAVIYPIIAWIKDFIGFLRKNKEYYHLWLFLWALYFNLISITVAFFAWFFYFASSYNFLSFYTQVVKLMTDLAPMVRFLPVIVWFIFGVWIYNYVCTSMAFAKLYYGERANRAFLRKRGIVSTIYGFMGAGKTNLITSMALSSEQAMWDDAFEIILENDLRFPNFPWHKLRDYIKREVRKRTLCDLDQVKARIQSFRRGFDYIIDKGYTPEEWSKLRKRRKIDCPDYTFGYDFEHYSYKYNDGMKIIHLYEAVEEYACAYLIYTVETSLIFANYSIRVDSIVRDVGNMPERRNDFFKKDPRLMESYSRQCHIINFDMLRLGKRMRKEFKLSFGTFVITEVDKERKNALELKEVKRSEEGCNQVNDLFNACLMMCRHAAVIANRVFIRIICDLQRPEAWGAGGRELGEVMYIKDKGELYPVMPALSPYWLCEGLFSLFKGKWDEFKAAYITERRDGTLFDYIYSNVTSKINNHYDKIKGQFGMFELKLELQSGRMDGEVTTDVWRIFNKKDRSKRYKTDCLNTVFATYEPNRMHIDDFICYAGEIGTLSENGLQASFFQEDLRAMRGKAA